MMNYQNAEILEMEASLLILFLTGENPDTEEQEIANSIVATESLILEVLICFRMIIGYWSLQSRFVPPHKYSLLFLAV